jgi:hypothetical protein
MSKSLASLRVRTAVVIAIGMTIALGACDTRTRKDTRDEMARFASLDSASAPGRNLLWRAHACVQRAQSARTDTLYPATDSALHADSMCSALPLGSSRSAEGWRVEYRRLRDTAGYELRADRDDGGDRPISLYSRVLAHAINADAGMVHAREGDSLATWSDPVVGSPLPALVWLAWCLEENQTTRDSGVEGYLVHIRPLADGDIRCIGTPPFAFAADSDETILSANGMEYVVRYDTGPLDHESLNEEGRDGDMRPILEWQVNTSYALRATPVRYGETGIRSYYIEPNGGAARGWITTNKPVDADPSAYLEAPMCEWIRGTSCTAPHPNPNDGSFGPGLLTILHAAQYPAH